MNPPPSGPLRLPDLPLNAGPVRLRALRSSDLEPFLACRGDDELVGHIGLLHEAPGQVQLGFTLARHAQGRGWAQAALQPLCDRLLRVPASRCLRAICDSRNAASLRLLARLGLAEVARVAVVVAGEACTDVIFERRPA